MRGLTLRLARLERRFRIANEGEKDDRSDSLAALLEARRMKRGLPPRDPTLAGQFRGMSLSEILNSTRAKANPIVRLDGEIPASGPEAPAVHPPPAVHSSRSG
jgi:hypothetical protein